MRDGIAVVGPGELQSIRSDWEALWTTGRDSSPFHHPAWLLPWAEVYAPGRCWAVSCRAGGKLAAVVPLFIWEGALLLAGTGPSDHASALFAPEFHSRSAMLGALAESASEKIGRIDLKQLPPGSPLLEATAPADFRSCIEPGEPCLAVPLSGENGMAAASTRTRSHWRYAIRKLEREGAVMDLVAEGEAPQAAVELERLHALRWNAEGQDGVLADGLAERHLRLAIPELARAGLLRMHRLRLGGETVALVFAMRGSRSTCSYLSGFEPALQKLSPGTTLVGMAITEAAREHCDTFDLLRGDEAYKLKWGAKPQARFRRVLSRKHA